MPASSARRSEGIGFAILEGHGVEPQSTTKPSEGSLRSSPRRLDEKMRFRAQRHGSVNQGYFPIKETSDIHPDLVEGWVFCRRAFALGETTRLRETILAAAGLEPSSAGSASPTKR